MIEGLVVDEIEDFLSKQGVFFVRIQNRLHDLHWHLGVRAGVVSIDGTYILVRVSLSEPHFKDLVLKAIKQANKHGLSRGRLY